MQLNEGHLAQINTFNAYYRGETARFCADKDRGLLEFLGDQLPDDQAIYNAEQIKILLNQYHQNLLGLVREEAERTVNRSSVYMSQLFYQAEQAGVALAGVDIQQCENAQMAAQVVAMAQQANRAALPAKAPTLGPIGAATADPQTVQQLQDAVEQNRQKDDRILNLQMEMTGLLKERSTMSAENEKMRENIKGLRMSRDPQAGQIDPSLQATKAMLDSKNAECDAMRQDLQRRLGDSAQFRDLKTMMKRKSDEVKELKRMLLQAGIQPPGSMSGGIELDADDD